MEPLIARWTRNTGKGWFRSITLEGDRAPGSGQERGSYIRARFAEKTRVVGHFDTPFGRANRTEGAGPDRKRFLVSTNPGYSTSAYIPATKDGVDSLLRRARPQDLEQVEAIDQELAALNQRAAELRRARVQALHQAWQKGHKVPLKDVVAMAEGVAQ